MTLPREAMLLRIFIGENDRSRQGQPLYEAIVLKAREVHLAGATVLRGPMGYGHNSRLHTTRILQLSENLPLIVEIVDIGAWGHRRARRARHGVRGRLFLSFVSPSIPPTSAGRKRFDACDLTPDPSFGPAAEGEPDVGRDAPSLPRVSTGAPILNPGEKSPLTRSFGAASPATRARQITGGAERTS